MILGYNHSFKIPTRHSFHLIDPSPWPIIAASSALMTTVGLVSWMHAFTGGWNLTLTGVTLTIFIMLNWWRDIIREATFEEQHKVTVRRGLRFGMLLFIISEIMFFFALFWAFFHSSLSPVFNIGSIWPPKAITPVAIQGIPLTNTFFLLSSGATITWGHHSIIAQSKKHGILAIIATLTLALLFTALQGLEYTYAPFNISDSVFGSCFYLTTGFHGFHVFIGTIAIFVSFIRLILNHFTNTHHFGFEAAIWYWHFVDIVWVILLCSLYWWGQ